MEANSKHEVLIKVNVNRGLSILDLILRVFAAIVTSATAIAMATTKQTLPFSFQAFQFKAEYKDFPMFKFFVIANSIVCGYLLLSLSLSIFHMIKTSTKISRIVLLIFDTVMLVLLTSGASAATSIVSLAHKGNRRANWVAICQPFRFSKFCHRLSGSLVGSFISIFMFMLIIIISSVSFSQL